MNPIHKLLTFIILVICISCGNNRQQGEVAADVSMEKSAVSENKEQAPDSDRKIIKEGEITFETFNATETRMLISNSVSAFNGYISRDNVYDYSNKTEHRITIRVPADKFEKLLEKISASAEKLDSKNITASDVTEEFIDVEARIKTKKELEGRYKELLKQAKKVEELLAIEKELGALRSDIESMEGRLKYLNDKVSFSALTVVFYERTSAAFGFNSKVGQAIHNGWNNLLWFFVGLINLWPFVLIGFIVIVLYKRRSNRKKKISS